MGFNAGGTFNIPKSNTNLLILDGVVSVTGNGDFSVDFVVPVGKIYNLKSFRIRKSSGTFTVGTVLGAIRISGVNVALKKDSIDMTESIGEQNLYLPAGATIKAICTITGWSVTGNIASTSLVGVTDI